MTTDRMAPNWIKISNTLARGPVKPNISPTRIICPVEDTGKYSVKPSTIPKIMAIIESLIVLSPFRFNRPTKSLTILKEYTTLADKKKGCPRRQTAF